MSGRELQPVPRDLVKQDAPNFVEQRQWMEELRHNINTFVNSPYSENVVINQPLHGLSAQESVYFDGSVWTKAKADAEVTLGSGVVGTVIDPNNAVIIISGKVTGLSGLTSGEWYYTSDTTAGLLTTTESSIYSNPMLLATGTAEGVVYPLRASEGPAARYIDAEIDGGFSNSVYLVSQHIDGGAA